MKRIVLIKRRIGSAAIASGLLLSGAIAPAIAQGDNATIQQTYSGRIGFVPPADDAAPQQTRGGATRGRCQATSLMPRGGTGATTKDRASLYVHLAKHPEARLSKAILMLKNDADESEQYDAIVELPEASLTSSGGIVEIEMPESMPALEIGKQYSWSLIMICDDLPVRPDSPVVGGGIKRVAPPAGTASLDGMTPVALAAVYGESGLWYDLISTLVSAQPGSADYAQLNGALKQILIEAGMSEEVSAAALVN